MPVIYPITCTFCVIYVHFYGKIKTLSDHVPFMGSCLFVPSIYVSPETTCLNYTRGPWVTRRPSNQGSKRGVIPCGSGGKNLGQGLGFCNFLPGKLPHTGTFYISSARPPIVIHPILVIVCCCGTNLGIAPCPHLTRSAHRTKGPQAPLSYGSTIPPTT